MTDKLSKLFEQYKMNPREAAQKSKNWFTQQVNLLNATKINSSMLMKSRNEMQRAGSITPGSMYVFKYSALHAETLPYWDRYPLVIPFSQGKGSFHGLNLHYLHPQLRVQLLDKLMMYATNADLDENTKLKFTWHMAAAAAKNKYIGSCVKMYLTQQVQSQFQKVLPEYWTAALMLPLESFQNTSKQSVWRESRRVT